MQLPVADDVPLPATLDDWRALTPADRDELYAAWTDEVLVDVATSELIEIGPGALGLARDPPFHFAQA